MSRQLHEHEQVHKEVFIASPSHAPMNGSADSEPDTLDGLIDTLEALAIDSQHVPLTRLVLINQDQLLDLVDRMRAALPGEVQQARRVLNQQEQILTQAQDQAFQLLQERGLMQRLEAERQKIVATAERDADRTRAEADKYARDVLIQLQSRLEHVQASVQQGIDTLDVPEE